jgi:hypothetical protein
LFFASVNLHVLFVLFYLQRTVSTCVEFGQESSATMAVASVMAGRVDNSSAGAGAGAGGGTAGGAGAGAGNVAGKSGTGVVGGANPAASRKTQQELEELAR